MLKLTFLFIIGFSIFAKADWITESGPQAGATQAIAASVYHHPQALKVFWWNIEMGEQGQASSPNPLENNLKELVENPTLRPHILILGEFSMRALSEQTLDLLLTYYTAENFNYNNQTPDFGLAIFYQYHIDRDHHLSTYMESQSTDQTLDWAPILSSPRQSQIYRQEYISNFSNAVLYTRTYLRFSYHFLGKTYHIVPVHLLQPWQDIKFSEFQTPSIPVFGESVRSVFNAYEKTFGTGLKILGDDSNPLYSQLVRLCGRVKSDLGDNFNLSPEQKVLLMGDFNYPRNIGIYSIGFRYMKNFLQDAFSVHDNTFPTASSGESYPAMKIDHAFINGLTAHEARVLPLSGSDHFPIYVVIE